MTKNRLRYIFAIVALVTGLVIVNISVSGAGIIRENIVSCIPEELIEMFDQDQAMICSNIQSYKFVLLTGLLLGGCLVVTGFVVVLVGVIRLLVRKTVDQTNLTVPDKK